MTVVTKHLIYKSRIIPNVCVPKIGPVVYVKSGLRLLIRATHGLAPPASGIEKFKSFLLPPLVQKLFSVAHPQTLRAPTCVDGPGKAAQESAAKPTFAQVGVVKICGIAIFAAPSKGSREGFISHRGLPCQPKCVATIKLSVIRQR